MMQHNNDEEKSLSRFLDILAILFAAIGCFVMVVFVFLSIYLTITNDAFSDAYMGWVYLAIGAGSLLVCLFMTGVLFGINRLIANTKMLRIHFTREVVKTSETEIKTPEKIKENKK